MTAPFVRFEDFLDPDAHGHVLAAALAAVDTAQLVPASTSHPDSVTPVIDEHFRSSLTAAVPEDVWRHFETPLRRLLPFLRDELGVGWFGFDRIERALTMHGDGGFFAKHVDNGTPVIATRKISFVYHCHIQPKPFEGGELRLFPGVGSGSAPGTSVDVRPENNTLVCFRADTPHEVRPVRTLSGAATSGRFTVNGWFHENPGRYDAVMTALVHDA